MEKIGIDAGGTLIKVAYEERGHLHVKTYENTEKAKLFQWLHMLAPDATLCGTGGRWQEIATKVKQNKQSVDEFNALITGTRYLLQKKGTFPEEYILVSVGTGTSIFYVNENKHERVLGSGIGGGTWMGLGSLITSAKGFRELVELADSGNHQKSDLLVKDIYGSEQAPLVGELTAANFGKAHVLEAQTEADHAAALNQLIGETILSLAGQVASAKNTQQIVFVGSTLQGNKPLQKVITSFEEMLPYEPVFLEKGAYAGAIGALLT